MELGERNEHHVMKRPTQDLATSRSRSGSSASANLNTNSGDAHGSYPEKSAGNKRRRTVLACSACRTRKTRCDGGRPVCSACEGQGYQCVYEQATSSNNVTVGREHLFILESRLSALERNFKSLERQNSNLTSSQSQLPAERKDDYRLAQENSVTIVEDEASPILSGLDDPTDSMGAMVFTDEEDYGFFGLSSNIAFTRQISQAVARVTRDRQTFSTPGEEESLKFAGRMTRDSGPASPVSRPWGTEHQKPDTVNVYFIPTEVETRKMIKTYFKYIGTLNPYIHQRTFMQTYEETKDNNFRKMRRTWLGLLNMVLALATSVPYCGEVTVEKRTKKADEFYQRALGLCKEQMMRGTSVEVVQLLLLVGQYLQGTRQSLQTYTIHGLAVKAALQLGLHSSEALKRFPPLDREIRRRTWYGCIILDRSLSVNFGRPCTIHEDYVRIELPNRYPESSQTDALLDRSEVVSLEFFNATITLYTIGWKAINLLYGGNVGSDKENDVFDNIAQVFSLEQQLIAWRGNLPPSLATREARDLSGSADSNLLAWERPRLILALRYHNIRILVHRLVLVRFLDMAGKDGCEQQFALMQQMGFHSAQICMYAASEIITITHRVVHSTGVRRTSLDGWWFTLYYTFNAALVIFSGLLILKTSNAEPPFAAVWDVSRNTLDEAAAALQILDIGNRMSTKCSKYIERLGHLVDSIGNSQFTHRQGISAMPNHSDDMTTYNGLGDASSFPMAAPNTHNDLYISPLGMEFGDFIVGDDMDFLNTFFDTSTIPA